MTTDNHIAAPGSPSGAAPFGSATCAEDQKGGLAGSNPAAPMPDAIIDHVRHALNRLRFGDIRLTVHEGKLVQIDITEKKRLTNN